MSTSPPTPCPYCGAPVEPGADRCLGCDAPLLYGLIAPPQRNRQVQDRAAAVLAAVPGGPGLLEARRRVREGLPLVVGLSRRRTEEVQSRLVDAGLLPRIGPAPRGTAPLEPERATHGLARRVAVALALPVVAFALFRALEPRSQDTTPEASSAAAGLPEATPAPRLELNAGLERERHGHLWLVCLAAVVESGQPPSGDVALRLRDETGAVLWSGTLAAGTPRGTALQADGGTRTRYVVSGRLSVDAFLRGGERLTLEGAWQGRTSAPIPIEVPAKVSFR